MQDHDVVPGEPEMLETGQNVVRLGEKVGKDDHKGTSLHHHRNVVQLLGNCCFGGRLGILEQSVHLQKNAHRRSGREVGPYFRVENGQAYGIPLL